MREELRNNLDHLQAPEITPKDRLLILTLINLVEAIDEIAASVEVLAYHLGGKR